MMVYPKLKPLFDGVVSLIGIVVLSPVYLVISALIKLDSKGPVIFKQERMGKNKETFTMYKFRIMVQDAEKLKEKYKHLDFTDGPVFKIKDDPRYTKIGKLLNSTNLDELPQLFNILKGDMSLVGYRPPIPEEVEQYKKWQLERFKGHPGLTSLWAISGMHDIPFDGWIKMDIDYNEHISFLGDLRILVKTGLYSMRRIIAR